VRISVHAQDVISGRWRERVNVRVDVQNSGSDVMIRNIHHVNSRIRWDVRRNPGDLLALNPHVHFFINAVGGINDVTAL